MINKKQEAIRKAMLESSEFQEEVDKVRKEMIEQFEKIINTRITSTKEKLKIKQTDNMFCFLSGLLGNLEAILQQIQELKEEKC